MKHRVAILLALTLTFSNLSFVGTRAAEVPADRNAVETVENREGDGTEVPEEEEASKAAQDQGEGQGKKKSTDSEVTEGTAGGQEQTEQEQSGQGQSGQEQAGQEQSGQPEQTEHVQADEDREDEEEPSQGPAPEQDTEKDTELDKEQEEGQVEEQAGEQTPADVTQEETQEETAEEAQTSASGETDNADAAQEPAAESADQKQDETEEKPVEEVVVKEVAEDAKKAGVSAGWNSAHTMFFENGKAVTGFRTIGGARYYFDGSGRMVTGFRTINGAGYYFQNSYLKLYKEANKGKMVTGLKTIKGSAYYFGQNGVMRTGWVKINGIWAYYKDNGKADKQGWKQKGDDRFYLNKSGRARTGWKKLNAKSIYYLDKAKGGAMVTGPFRLAKTGKYYFFDEKGRRATTRGWKTFGGYSYYTYKSGVIAVNKTINGVKIGANGRVGMSPLDIKAYGYSSNTNYLILVSRGDHLAAVYKGRKGSWIKVKGDWPCAVGVSTPRGVWVLESSSGKTEYGWRDFDDASAAFCTSVSGGFYFHSILYQKGFRDDPYTAPVEDDKLGFNCSEMGVRLKSEYAEWIRNNIPVGTKVVLY